MDKQTESLIPLAGPPSCEAPRQPTINTWLCQQTTIDLSCALLFAIQRTKEVFIFVCKKRKKKKGKTPYQTTFGISVLFSCFQIKNKDKRREMSENSVVKDQELTSKSWSIPKSWSKYTTLVGFSRQLCQKFIETKGKCFDKRLPYQFHCRYRQVAISRPCTTRRLQHRRLRCSKSLSTLYHCCHVSHVDLFLHPENQKIVSNWILILHLC